MSPPASRKRPATGAPGHAGKKPRVGGGDASKKPSSDKPARRGGVANRERAVQIAKKKAEPEPKRKVPITGAARSMDVDEDDEGDDDEEDVEMEDAAAGPSRGVSNGNGNSNGDGDQKRLSKAEKAALHAAQPHRTTLLPSHPLLQDTLLPLWEQARRADISKQERTEAISALWNAVKGRVKEVARGHKGGRVLQTIVKYGGKEERNGLAHELDGQYREMMESKYSKFLMAKLIRYCPSIRPLIISQIMPVVPQLLFHAHACSPLADFFELYASPKEKRLLVRGFYPKEVLLFDGVGVGKDGKAAAEAGKSSDGLQAVLDGMKDGKARERVLEELNEKIVHVFNSPQKEALAQAIFHRVVLEYLMCVYAFLGDEEADKKMHDLLEASLESLADILHTKDGAAVVREFIARGTAKDRKNILRVLKPHLQKIAEDGDAQLVLFAAFDYVDDTKMMGKAIISEIGQLAPELAMHKMGRRVLLYLLVHRSSRYFIASTVDQLKKTDASSVKTSKKDAAVRRAELKAVIDPDLIKLVETHAEPMLRDAGASLLLVDILLEAQGDKTKALEALLPAVRVPYPNPAPSDPEPDPETSHVLDLSYASRAYKTLLAGGRFQADKGTVEVKLEGFAKTFWSAITSDEAGGESNAVNIALGNAPFTVVELVNALEDDKQVRKVLCSADVISQVEKSWRKGANVLAEKLKSM